ncbi:methionine adenosyltransferase [Dysosmobacter sp.]|uniref:methionine adenosyltransferase n=1 Tax=Dysosmobacter sp. TaxID=2591382 RepID=UPI002A8DC4FF|nr:methionine adenosyltransferase [Dysosmobacter sp.]MDY3985230.1 methionine adenosyltransferase [Dysosmobacter sp.]
MRKMLTSESVTEGHPDKICDFVADSILDELLRADPKSRSAVEVTAEPGAMHIMGEITSKASPDYVKIARRCIAKIGYTKSAYGFDAISAQITCSIHEQSPDIAMGVDAAADGSKDVGAGDQGMMFGYACDETPELMPLPITMAHALTSRLTEVRKTGMLAYLRPDGKAQVTVEYEDGTPVRVDTVVVSAQHAPDIDMKTLRKDILEQVIFPTIDAKLLDENTKYYINPTGRFVLGGPAADTGLTGRKIICDTYGGIGHHGGGAFSGKDATKVDRSAAYMARHIAKTAVAAGAAKQLELQLGYAIGVSEPVSISIDTFGTGRLPDDVLCDWVRNCFDLRPSAIIQYLKLDSPIFAETTNYGHFGRSGFSWEQVNETAMDVLRLQIG